MASWSNPTEAPCRITTVDQNEQTSRELHKRQHGFGKVTGSTKTKRKRRQERRKSVCWFEDPNSKKSRIVIVIQL